MTIGGNPLVMKEINTNLVRRVLRAQRSATRQQLAAATGLSIVTVAAIAGQLILAGEAREGDQIPSNGGRPSRLVEFNADYAKVLALFAHEIAGKDRLSLRVANLYGECVDAGEEETAPESLAAFEPLIDRMLAKHPSIKAIGFGLPGIESGGTIVALDYRPLIGAPIIEHFRLKYGLLVLFENDVNSAVMGCCRRQSIDAHETVVYLYVPRKYPPGAGIRIGGKLFKGRNNFAGEVAHLPLGIGWGQPELYGSFDRICLAIAKLIVALASVINPDKVILHGEFLGRDHMKAIADICGRDLPVDVAPRLEVSENFTLDFQTGLIEETLTLLEPINPLSD
ncbi:MAG TPA: ROK family protein [Rectinemataceae bacterium]|nr:ROK family protein [Rectinemataceae bacterium]